MSKRKISYASMVGRMRNAVVDIKNWLKENELWMTINKSDRADINSTIRDAEHFLDTHSTRKQRQSLHRRKGESRRSSVR